ELVQRDGASVQPDGALVQPDGALVQPDGALRPPTGALLPLYGALPQRNVLLQSRPGQTEHTAGERDPWNVAFRIRFSFQLGPRVSRSLRSAPMIRLDGRAHDQLRPLSFTPGFAPHATGSVLVATGDTRVICSAMVEEAIPRWMKEQQDRKSTRLNSS